MAMAPSELNQRLHGGIEQLILQGAQEHVGLLWHEEGLEKPSHFQIDSNASCVAFFFLEENWKILEDFGIFWNIFDVFGWFLLVF